MSRPVMIDDDVMRQIELAAAASKTTVDDFIAQALRRALPVSFTEHPTSGFPMFAVPTDAPAFTTEDVRRAEDEA